MKKIICLLLVILMAVPMFSCGTSENSKISESNTSENKTDSTEGNSNTSDTTYSKIDYDLVAAGSTIAYAGVTSMWNDPSPYIGKIIKVNGSLGTYTDSSTGKVYYSCMLSDQTACCSQYIEFVLNDGKYPETGTEITVTGVFGTYKEGDQTFIQLTNAVLS